MAVTVWELFGVWGCLVVVFAALLCLCLHCNERYSHRTTVSVSKGLDILPHSFLLSSKLRYVLYTLVVQVEGRTCLRAEYFTYITYI